MKQNFAPLTSTIFILFIISNRFPCTVGDCKKEYRTQWELNSHNRLKHSKPESVDEIVDETYVSQFECDAIDIELNSFNVKNDKQSCEEEAPKSQHVSTGVKNKPPTRKKTAKKNQQPQQQIIYIMPGPTNEHVIFQNTSQREKQQQNMSIDESNFSKDFP